MLLSTLRAKFGLNGRVLKLRNWYTKVSDLKTIQLFGLLPVASREGFFVWT